MNRLLCYAHFDEGGEVKDFVKHALVSMRSVCSTHVFVSNSPITRDDRQLLEPLCKHVITKENIGLDFHMWQKALELEQLSDYDEIVLMNSSIYGPILPIAEVFQRMEAVQCDFWGITECFQMRPHIQSYFLVFRKPVVDSAPFAAFWKGVLPYVNKHQIVMSYEVGLTQWLVDSGFKPGIYCNVFRLAAYAQRLGKRVKLKDNQTIKYPKELFAIGNPFLKREFVRTRPSVMPTLRGFLQNNGYPESFLQENAGGNVHVCPICGTSGRSCYEKVRDRLNPYNSGRYRYFKCSSNACGVLWTNSSGNAASDTIAPLEQFGSELPTHVSQGENRGRFPRRISSGLNKLAGWLGIHAARSRYEILELDQVPPGKLLAIDCDAGRASRLRNLGWDVTQVTVDDLMAGDKLADRQLQFRFDVLFLPDVIGQVLEARVFLQACNETLKPNGKLYVSTPNARSFSHSLFRKYWFGIDPPRGRLVYSTKSLQRLLSDSSFSPVKVRTISSRAEKYVLHSMDICLNKWTYHSSGQRLGREFLPLLLQLLFWLGNGILGGRGEECFVVAEKSCKRELA